jgi:hypothetical protein
MIILLLVVVGIIIALALYVILGITIQGKMTGGATCGQAWIEIFKELFGIKK